MSSDRNVSCADPTDDVAELVAELGCLGISVWAEHERLRYRAPAGQLTPGLKERLTRAKPAVIEALRTGRQQAEGPLSHGQEALWLQHRLAPGSSAYHVAFAGYVHGAFSRAHMIEALRALADRHAILRTTYDLAGQTLVARYDATLDPALSHVVSRAGTPAEKLHEVRGCYELPFDLQNQAPLRVHVVEFADRSTVMLVCVHHIAADGWSLWLILSELRTLYAAACEDKASTLGPPPAPYAEFVSKERARLSAGGDALRAFWRETLAGTATQLSWGRAAAKPGARRFAGASRPVPIDAALVRRVRDTAKREGVSFYVALLTAYSTVLAQQLASDDFLVGCPTAGRDQAEFESTLGHFINVVPLRVSLQPEDTFGEFMRRLRQVVQHAVQHRDLPFAQIEAQLRSSQASGAGLLRALCILVQPQLASDLVEASLSQHANQRVPFGNTWFEPFAIAQQEGQADLVLEVLDSRSDQVQANLKYDIDVLDAADVDALARRLVLALEALSGDPKRRVADVDLLPADERALLSKWNQTQTDFPALAVHELFERQVERTPGRTAVRFGSDSIDYGQLNAQANRLARMLRERGVGAEALVGVCVDRSIELIAALLAILKSGGAFVPLVSELPQARLEAMLDDARPLVILCDARHRAKFERQAQVLCIPDVFDTLDGAGSENLLRAVKPTDLAYVMYTSGSTGTPKGVMCHHGGLSNRIQWGQAFFQFRHDDVVLQKTPLGFDISLWECFSPLVAGATLVMARPDGHRDPAYLVDVIARERVTVLHFVPSMFRVFLQEPNLERCSSVRLTVSGGEALKPDLVRRYYALLPGKFYNLYGPTEASIEVTYQLCEPNDAALVPIGRPIANARIHVLNHRLQPVPPGVNGELYIGGIPVARGYLNRETLDRERFVPDPFSATPGERLYKTGDLARFTRDGTIEYLGRMDRQVKVRGMRIELEEVECVLSACSGVTAAVLQGPSHEHGSDGLRAWYVGAATIAELRAHATKHLPAAMVPAVFVHVDAMPVGRNGKVDYARLPQPTVDVDEESCGVHPQDLRGTERVLLTALCAVLERDRADPDAVFFALGVDSLSIVRLHQRLRLDLGREIELTTLFEYPTCRALAAWLEREPPSVADQAPSSREAGRSRLAERRARQLTSTTSKA